MGRTLTPQRYLCVPPAFKLKRLHVAHTVCLPYDIHNKQLRLELHYGEAVVSVGQSDIIQTSSEEGAVPTRMLLEWPFVPPTVDNVWSGRVIWPV
jgi:hypothetical protein